MNIRDQARKLLLLITTYDNRIVDDDEQRICNFLSELLHSPDEERKAPTPKTNPLMISLSAPKPTTPVAAPLAARASRVMQFGKYKGERFDDVPASYLLWLWDNDEGLWQDDRKAKAPLRDYIVTNFKSLLHDAPRHINHPTEKLTSRGLLGPSITEIEDKLMAESGWQPNQTPMDDIPF